MQIRRFYANTLSSAMRDIRRSLGPDAFIMSSRQLPAGHKVYMQDGSRPRFEVTAAVESAGGPGGDRPMHDFQPASRPATRPAQRRNPDAAPGERETSRRQPSDSARRDDSGRAADSGREPDFGRREQPAGYGKTRAPRQSAEASAAKPRDLTEAANRVAGLLRKPRPPVQPQMKDMLAGSAGSILKRSFPRQNEQSASEEPGAAKGNTPARPKPGASQETAETARVEGDGRERKVKTSVAKSSSEPESAPRGSDGQPSLLEGVGSVAELREIIQDLKALRQELRNGGMKPPAPGAPAPGRPNPYQERADREASPPPATSEEKALGRPSQVFAGSHEEGGGETRHGVLPACDLQKALRAQGVEQALLQRILDRVHFDPEADDDGRGAFRNFVRVVQDFIPRTEPLEPPEDGPRIVVLTGPTGVGKTTTIAKIASHHALMENQRVGLVTLDTCRVGAAEQLKTYARLLGVPVKVQSDPSKLQQTINEFDDMDLVLVDTPGLSPVDVASFERLCEAIRPLSKRAEIHLEMTASTRGDEMRRIMEIYRPLHYNRLIFSKMDEAGRWGELLNTWIMGGASVSYFTTGQRVPEDFEDASLEALCEALVTDV